MLRALVFFAITAAMFLAASLTAPTASAKDGRNLTVKQMEQQSSRQQAKKYLNRLSKQKLSQSQGKKLLQRADRVRGSVRSSQTSQSEDQQWANLIAPLNRCTDLVRQTCGVQKQCGDSAGCGLALQILDIYNAEPSAAEKYEVEENCIISLSDHIAFPSCQ